MVSICRRLRMPKSQHGSEMVKARRRSCSNALGMTCIHENAKLRPNLCGGLIKIMTNKDKHYWNILDAVFRLEVTKGHLRWKISDVSRLAGVQRTLVYYYF